MSQENLPNGIDRTINIEEEKPNLKFTKEQKDSEIQRFNNTPIVKENKIIAVNKNSYLFYKLMVVIFALLFLGAVIWTNLNLSLGKLADHYNTTVNNEINVKNSDLNVSVKVDDTDNNYNNYTIVNQIKIDEKDLEKIADIIVKEINGS